MWFDRMDLVASFETPEGTAAVETLIEDEMKFIDFSGSAIRLSKENVLIDQFSRCESNKYQEIRFNAKS